jgi:hypothetical protein
MFLYMQNKKDVSKLYYITIATKPHKVLDKIKSTVEKNGEEIITLGLQENRVIGWEGSSNFGVKLREVADFIRRPNLKENDLVLFTDAYDVAYCGTQKEILRRYLTFKKPIVFGCEKGCHPDQARWVEYPSTENEFPYLNSGLFIGRVKELRECMSDYYYNDGHDDQRFWTIKFLENQDKMELDYENYIFLNTVDMELDKFTYYPEHNTAYYKWRNPLFVHINGPVKTMIERFL